MANTIIAAVNAWLRAVNDRRTLADMPDYLLKDIGLRREQVDAAIAGGAWRDDVAQAPAGVQAKARPALTVVATAQAARPATKPAAPKENLAA